MSKIKFYLIGLKDIKMRKTKLLLLILPVVLLLGTTRGLCGEDNKEAEVLPFEAKNLKKAYPLMEMDAIRQFEVKMEGYGGTEIVFASQNMFPIKKITEGSYQVGDYISAKGVYSQYQANLNFIKVSKINQELLCESSYLQVLIPEPLPIAYGTVVEVEGEVTSILSQSSLVIGTLSNWQELFLDKDAIFYECAETIRQNASLIAQATMENEELKEWMRKKYQVSNLLEEDVINVVENLKQKDFKYDFFDQVGIYSIDGPNLKDDGEFGVAFCIKCLYDDNSRTVPMMIVSFLKTHTVIR
jgi:hypothetical protein